MGRPGSLFPRSVRRRLRSSSCSLIVALALAACGDPEDPNAETMLEGVLFDATSEAPVVGTVTGFPDLGTVATSSPAGTFRLEGARFGIRYRVVAEAQGYLSNETSLVPRFGSAPVLEIPLTPAVACRAGESRCARGGLEGVEQCSADGRGFSLSPCATGQVCDAAAPRCVDAPTVTVSVAGNGSVVSNPSGLVCEPTCEKSFPVGTELVLEARPFGDGGFASWGGACAGSDPVCRLRLDADRTVEASFETTAYRLSVETRGGGRVRSMPPGIDCGGQCQAFFDAGAEVTLMATPDAGRSFRDWQQDCSGSSPTCVVGMDGNRRARARFVGGTVEVTVRSRGGGIGRVVSTPSGIDCGATCAARFSRGASLRLEASPESGAVFAGWDGACASAGDNPSCAIAPDADAMADARFEPFYLAPLPADASCRFGLDFEAPDPLDPGCGSAAPVSAPEWSATPSRSDLLADAFAAPPSGAPVDLGAPLPGLLPATVELTARRGADPAVLISDHDARDPARAGWSLRALADGRLVASTFDGGGGSTSATTAPGLFPADTWAHVAVVASSSGLAVFVDGREEARAMGAPRLAASSSTAWVGATRTGAGSTGGLGGAVDAIRVSDAARYP